MDFYDKFVDRFQKLSKIKNPAVSKLKGFRTFKRKCIGEYDPITLTMLYMLTLLNYMVSQNS